MTDSDDRIPVIEIYKGIGIHDRQSPARIERVKLEIDRCFSITDVQELYALARSPLNAPEARLLAAALIEAQWEFAAADRRVRPDIDIEQLRASVAGLDSITWRDPDFYCSLLDVPKRLSGQTQTWSVRREVPLTDA